MWLLVLFFTFSNAQARWLKIDESPTVIDRLHVAVDVRKDGTYTQTVHEIIKVQSDDAKVNASIFSIEYNSATDEPEVIEAFTENGKNRYPVPASAIEDRDKGDSRDYDALRIRKVVYPQVQVGSRLHIKYRIVNKKPLLQDRWSAWFSFSPWIHIKDMKITVRSERPLFHEISDPGRYLKYRLNNKNKFFEVSNRKTLPGWVHAEKNAWFHPAGSSQVWLSTEKDWAPFLSEIEKEYEKILDEKLPSKLESWVREAKRKKTPEEKMLSILEKMSVEFRYFGDWRRHNGGLVPRTLAEIEASRYGDCKDLSILVTRLLRELGLNARVALVRRGENPYGEAPDYNLPSIYRFNHAVLTVQTDQNRYWLDPTNPVASLHPNYDISGRPAWVISKEGGRFVRLAKSEPKHFQHFHEHTYRFLGEDRVKVNVLARLKNFGPFRLANDLFLNSRSSVLTSTLDYFSEGQEVRSYKFKKEPRSDRRLKDMEIELEYESGRIGYNAGADHFWVIPDGFLEGAFYETEDRESDLRLADNPYHFIAARRLINVRLAQSAPPACRIQSRWMDLERTVTVDNNDLLIVQTVVLKQPFIRRTEYRSPEFREVQVQAKRCFHRTGVLIQLRP